MSDSDEVTLFEGRPTAKSYLGLIIIGVLTSPLVIGLFILLSVFLKVKSTSYRLTSERLFVRQGIIAKKLDEIEMFRVKDVQMSQGVLQRIMGFGNITVISTDDTTPELKIVGMSNPEELKEQIRTVYRAARKAEKGATEFISS